MPTSRFATPIPILLTGRSDWSHDWSLTGRNRFATSRFWDLSSMNHSWIIDSWMIHLRLIHSWMVRPWMNHSFMNGSWTHEWSIHESIAHEPITHGSGPHESIILTYRRTNPRFSPFCNDTNKKKITGSRLWKTTKIK